MPYGVTKSGKYKEKEGIRIVETRKGGMKKELRGQPLRAITGGSCQTPCWS